MTDPINLYAPYLAPGSAGAGISGPLADASMGAGSAGASFPRPPAMSGPRQTTGAGQLTPPPPGTSGPISGPQATGLPPRPTNLAETHLDPTFLEELALKVVASIGTTTGNDLAERMRLPLAGVVEHLIAALRRETMIEPVGGGAAMLGAAGMNLRVTERGTARVHQINERSGYAGPAPVTLAAFDYALRQQMAGRRFVSRDLMWRRLAHLVLPDETVDRIGAGVESGGPLFLYGSPGNGKTAVGAAIARAVAGGVLVPHAVEVDGQVFRVFDSSLHRPLPPEAAPGARYDERWVLCQAPFVQVGGELRLDQLDLYWNERQRFYDCPIQVKAAGGVLLIDDFGRQQYRPEHLLNRWIVPLETGQDFLTLLTGRQVAIPFTPLLIFATNLDPSELVDEAFLRRLPCKIEVPDPTPDAFHEIFRRACTDLGVEYSDAGFDHLIERYYNRSGRTQRSSHPRDLLRLIVSCARYFGVAPQLSPQLIDVAAELYFV